MTCSGSSHEGANTATCARSGTGSPTGSRSAAPLGKARGKTNLCAPTKTDDDPDMLKSGHVESIGDTRIYNCSAKDGTANPHKLYGCLVHPVTAAVVAQWID